MRRDWCETAGTPLGQRGSRVQVHWGEMPLGSITCPVSPLSITLGWVTGAHNCG